MGNRSGLSVPAAEACSADRRKEEHPAPEPGESAALAASVARGRKADREVARGLGLRGPAGRGADARYLEALARRRPLTPERERLLVEAARSGDATARALLVEAFMPRIAAIARHYRISPNVERAELLQEGVAGLLRALQSYDPKRGVPFWAYARWWVRRSMQRLVAELTRPTVLSDYALRHLSRIKDAHRELYDELRREPTTEELAQRTGLPHDEVAELLAIDRPPRSVEEPLSTEDGAVWGKLEDMIADPMADGEYERVLDQVEAQELVSLLSGLSERERMILRAHYGLDGEPEQSPSEIAQRLGLSTARVREIERRARGKLAAAARTGGGDPEAEADAPGGDGDGQEPRRTS
jgi:RNA polymerase sigma factor (sigma-70 family)